MWEMSPVLDSHTYPLKCLHRYSFPILPAPGLHSLQLSPTVSTFRRLCATRLVIPAYSSANCVRLSATPWAIACQAPLSLGFSCQEYWSGLPLPAPGNLPVLGIKPMSPALTGGFFIPLNLLGSPQGLDMKAIFTISTSHAKNFVIFVFQNLIFKP